MGTRIEGDTRTREGTLGACLWVSAASASWNGAPGAGNGDPTHEQKLHGVRTNPVVGNARRAEDGGHGPGAMTGRATNGDGSVVERLWVNLMVGAVSRVVSNLGRRSARTRGRAD